jgi:hypothetical protein
LDCTDIALQPWYSSGLVRVQIVLSMKFVVKAAVSL